MTSKMSDVLLLSLFYWGLSVVMLRLVANARGKVFYLYSSGYAALTLIAGWKVNMKWVLVASLIFMIISMSITLWIILKQSRECIRDLKRLREEEQEGKPSIHKETSDGK